MTVITGQLSEAKHRCGGSKGGELRDERGALRRDDMLDTRRQDINRGEEVSDLKTSLYVDKRRRQKRGIGSELQVWCADVKESGMNVSGLNYNTQ